MKNFKSCKWLNKHKNDNNLFIIDCRFDLFDPDYGKAAYEKAHIKNAYYLDINKDICGIAQEHGGARPLPDQNEFIKKIEEIGINMDSTIICYDDITYSSGRAYWQFKYLGLKNVFILNGGLTQWSRLGLPVTQEIPKNKTGGNIQVNINKDIFRNINDIKKIINSDKKILLDAREYRRFTGEFEPLYAKAGHIPNAKSLYWQNNIDLDGTIKDVDELKELYPFDSDKFEIIAYCGSGIDGALNYVVLDELGFNVSLYVGSFSDWISYNENEIQTSD